MSSINRALLLGNLGRDAEYTTTGSGMVIAKFSIATSSRRKGAGGQYEESTQWHRIVVFGQQGERLRDYLKKGKQVYIEGRIDYRNWEDKDGNKRTSTEIIADRVQLMGGGGGGSSRPRQESDEEGGGGGYGDDFGGGARPPVPTADDDDIPF